MKKKKKLQFGESLPTVKQSTEPTPYFENEEQFNNYHKQKAVQGMSPEDRMFYQNIVLGKAEGFPKEAADSYIALKNPVQAQWKDYKKPKNPNKAYGQIDAPYGNVLGRTYQNGGNMRISNSPHISPNMAKQRRELEIRMEKEAAIKKDIKKPGKPPKPHQNGGKLTFDEYNKISNHYDDSVKQTGFPIDHMEKSKYMDKKYKALKDQKRQLNLKPIEDNRGQWAHPGEVTKINSNKITMKGVDYPVLGVSDTGHQQMMMPEQDYNFEGNNVTEYPMAKSGIHIKPENKGKFTAYKKRTGETTEEALHSKNPHVRQMANFAKNAKRFKHQEGGALSSLGGGAGILDSATQLTQGIIMLGQEKKQRQQADQFSQLSNVVKQASAIPVDTPKRKYVRPEDSLFDPNQMIPSSGVGTNYLAKNGGKYKKAQEGADIFGQYLNGYPGAGSSAASGAGGGIGQMFQQMGSKGAGSLGEMAGSAIGGGKGVPNGGGKIGSSLGGVAGSLLGGPAGAAIGSLAGGLIGGAIDGKNQKLTRRYQNQGYANLTEAAYNQGFKSIKNQYSGFMQNGGDLESDLSGLSTEWGGKAKTMSVNPYLPEEGETVMFEGNSHKEGGIGVRYGKNPVEVEGGEPAVKLKNGGDANLTVFGDMKIPSYGVSELGDKNAKNKKFKNYIKELSEKEAKQNKIVDNSLEVIDNDSPATAFDKLRISSAKSMYTGADMNLKDIANKKQTAANVQNAILETAEEHNLDSAELAKGNIKKAKKGARIAQFGDSVERSKVDEFLKSNVGWERDPENVNRLRRQYAISTGGEYKAPKNVDPDYEKAFADARKQGLETFPWKGGVSGTKLASEVGGYDTKGWDYKPIYDPNEDAWKNPMEIKKPQFNYTPEQNPVVSPQQKQRGNSDWMNIVNGALPLLRPSNRLNLDPNQLSGEMFALSTNQLDPVQAQLYHPLLEQTTDISLQDQMNANQADFNSLAKQSEYNPAAQSALAAQKYAANSGVLGDQFRQNQARKLGVYNGNREVLNDATLKNLGILDQQYVRQSQAKSNTKAVAQAALSSIADKIAKNKLENRTLGVYENLYNYRFGPNGHAWNMNGLAQFNTQGENLPTVDSNGKVMYTENETTQDRDRYGNVKNTRNRQKSRTKGANGMIVKSLKNI